MTERYRSRQIGLAEAPLAGVLFERPKDGWISGFSPDYLRVRVPEQPGLRNEIRSVHVRGLHREPSAGEVFFEGRLSV